MSRKPFTCNFFRNVVILQLLTKAPSKMLYNGFKTRVGIVGAPTLGNFPYPQPKKTLWQFCFTIIRRYVAIGGVPKMQKVVFLLVVGIVTTRSKFHWNRTNFPRVTGWNFTIEKTLLTADQTGKLCLKNVDKCIEQGRRPEKRWVGDFSAAEIRTRK